MFWKCYFICKLPNKTLLILLCLCPFFFFVVVVYSRGEEDMALQHYFTHFEKSQSNSLQTWVPNANCPFTLHTYWAQTIHTSKSKVSNHNISMPKLIWILAGWYVLNLYRVAQLPWIHLVFNNESRFIIWHHCFSLG